MKRTIIAVLFLALAAGGAAFYQTYAPGAAKAQAPAGGSPPVPVVVAKVVRKAMPVQLDAIGTVQPIASVAVKSRVDGQISEVRVTDGQYVHKGDVIFLLDTRAAEAQLSQATAQLARDRAQLANAQREVQRFKPLTEKEYISREQMDQVGTTAAAAVATVNADQAAVDNLKAQLTYYTIAAPMDGRIGVVTLKAGNAVKAQDTITMVSINQIHPIYVAYSVPQRDLPGIRNALHDGDVPVTATIPGDDKGPEKGRVFLFDNQIDATTGTIALRAIFDNEDERLWPGEFVNVTTTLRTEPDALVIPQAALLVGQNGNYVYVIKPDKTAETRPVTVDRTIGGETVISKGVNEGEQVVVEGQSRVTTGTHVEIRSGSAASGSNSDGNKPERSS